LSPAAQAATTVTLQYTCSFPVIGDQPMTASMVWNAAATHRVGQSTQDIPVTASATIGAETVAALNLMGVKSVQGTADISGGVVAPQGPIDGAIAMTVGKTAVPQSGSLTLVGNGTLPPAVFTQPGPATLEVNKTFTMSITPESASGGQTLLGVMNTTCTLDPGQSGVIANFEILAAAPATTSASAGSTPAAKPTSSSGNASHSGTASVVSAASAGESAVRNPAGSTGASASPDPTVSAAATSASASVSASAAARDPRTVAAKDSHRGIGIAQALALLSGAVAVGAMAVIIWWLGRRRRKNAGAMADGPASPAVLASCPPAEEEHGDEHGSRIEVTLRAIERDFVGTAGAAARTPHRTASGLARQRVYDRRRRTVKLDRHCRERDRHGIAKH
jgi:hypothetical protein